MMWQKSDWKDATTALSVASVIVAPTAVSLPPPFDKLILALSVGLANAAVLTSKHGNGNGGAATEKP